MRVTMPSGRVIAIDAKANLKAYLDAMEEPDPDKVEQHLREFADGVAKQAVALSKRGYWKQYDDSPEMVLMFIPGDQFVDAAYSKRPDLLELAAKHRVVIASPSTLIALLHAVHMGYEEQKLAREAQELRKLGQELHLRAVKAMDFVAKLGTNLQKANEAYNDFVGSYQTRLEPTLRKFQEGGATSGKELPTLTPIDATPRLLTGTIQRDEA
jgi:DNA recombination protein RmuC